MINIIDLSSLSLFFASLFTSVVSATLGMVGGVLLLTYMTFLIPSMDIVPIHGVVQLVSNFGRALILRRNICYSFLKPYAIGVPFGAILGVALLKHIFNEKIPLFCIALIVLYTVFKPKKLPQLKIPPRFYLLVGFVAGFLGILLGAIGPLIGAFLTRDDLKKEQVISTQAAMQTITHFVKIPSYLYLSFNFSHYSPLILGMCLMSVIGTNLGVKLLKKIPEKQFHLFFKIALFAASLRIFYKIIFN